MPAPSTRCAARSQPQSTDLCRILCPHVRCTVPLAAEMGGTVGGETGARARAALPLSRPCSGGDTKRYPCASMHVAWMLRSRARSMVHSTVACISRKYPRTHMSGQTFNHQPRLRECKPTPACHHRPEIHGLERRRLANHPRNQLHIGSSESLATQVERIRAPGPQPRKVDHASLLPDRDRLRAVSTLA